MLFIRRFPGILYNHKYGACIALFTLLTFIYLLYHWGFVCSNIEPRRHVRNLCNEYRSNGVVGDLCHPLCHEGTITSFSCQTFHAGKEAVFSAVKDENTRIVFKLARQSDLPSSVHWMEKGIQHYPTEAEFTRMIRDYVNSRFNTTISSEQATLLGRFSGGNAVVTTSSGMAHERHRQMQERWTLLQDNEYLLASLYADRDVFPRVIGSCGQYYALEYLEPAIEKHMLSEDSKWQSRIKLGVLLLDLLQEIDNTFSEGFSLCDVKPSHFGISPSSGKIKVLDLDVAFPRAIVNTITADGSTCRVNDDCSLFDCRSRCNVDTHRCDSPQTNDNLQIICEKIFLGWAVSGSVMMPGLLMAPQTPSILASLLRQCADADSDGVFSPPAENVRERLTATLQEMDKALSLDNY